MLISIEGCIGAGKTTVTKGLAHYRGSAPLLEAFEANPFLRAFTTNPHAYALETEFAFLLLHFHQMKSVREAVHSSEVISDFHLGKDLLYEHMNISDERTKGIFRALYDVCAEQTPPVDLMICLSAPDELIIDRILRRRRDFELNLDTDYYVRLNQLYESFFAEYRGNKMRIPMDEYDFVKSPEHYGTLSARIDARIELSL
jgi:deoxyadenosine/deoxycytidine kinase